MKTQNKKLLSIISVLALAMPFSAMAELAMEDNTPAAEFKVASVDVVDSRNLEVLMTKNIDSSAEIDLKLIETSNMVADAVVDYNSLNNVIVDLKYPLNEGDDYSILTILGGEGNMNFTLPENFADANLKNEEVLDDQLQYIESISFDSNQRMIVSYFSEIVDGEIEVQILRNIGVSEINAKTEDTLSVKTDIPMLSNKNYALTFVALNDVSGGSVSNKNAILSFSTPDLTLSEEDKLELNAAAEADAKDMKESKDIKAVAMVGNADLPGAGAKENIVIILSLILGFLFVYNRQRKLSKA